MILNKSKASGIYTVDYYTPAGRKRITTGTRDRAEAMKFVKEARLEEFEQLFKSNRLSRNAIMSIVNAGKVTMTEAVRQWAEWMPNANTSPRTIHNYTDHVMRWMNSASLSAQFPSSVTEKHIDEWVNQKNEWRASTRSVVLAALRSLFEFCTAKGWCLTNPVRLSRVRLYNLRHDQREPRKRQPLTDEEVDELLQLTEPGSFWNVAITVARHVGLRLGDICQLEWSCLNAPGKIVLWMDKTESRIELPIPPAVQRAIGSVRVEDDVYLFPEQRRIVLDPKHRSSLSVQFLNLCKKAGVKGKSFHSLRCSFAVSLKRSGKTVEQVSEALGHRHASTTQRYL